MEHNVTTKKSCFQETLLTWKKLIIQSDNTLYIQLIIPIVCIFVVYI